MFQHNQPSARALLFAAVVAVMVPSVTAQNASAGDTQIIQSYGNLPLQFEANHGQTDAQVKYLTRGSGYGLYFTDKEAVLALHHAATPTTVKTDVLRIQLAGTHSVTAPEGLAALPGITNYIQGDDQAAWHTNVPTFAKVRYTAVYPGIDLVYYGNHQQLEYDFVLAPHADAKSIRLHFAGARDLKIDSNGNLIIEAPDGSIAFHKPVVYQTIDNQRKPVTGQFTLLANNTAGFQLDAYDHTRSVVIDPSLIYSTYLGGNDSDSITAIAVDSAGNAYLAGSTSSTNFPTTAGAFQTTASTAFITKLASSGSALIYSTFLGPNATINDIKVDSSGNAYVVGSTTSTTFPTTAGAFQTTDKAVAHGNTGFVTELNPTGSSLVFSTFLGGSRFDTAYAIVLSSTGIYVAGSAYSNNFPTTTGAYQTVNNSFGRSGWNNFVAEFNTTGTSLIFSTMLGGSGDYNQPQGIKLALDSAGDAFIASTALSADFPTTSGAYLTVSNAKAGHTDMTISKFNPTGTALLFSTWLGGSGGGGYSDDMPNGLAVDSSGNVYVGGSTHEIDYPVTSGALQTTNKTGGFGHSTGFITKLNPAGTALVYSTYLGGTGNRTGDYVGALTIDSSNDVYVTGSSNSQDFPVTSNAYQTSNPAEFNNGSVTFLSELNPAGSTLLYSTYFGGQTSFADAGYGIALGSTGNVYLAGVTNAFSNSTSGGLPTTAGAYQTTNNASQDATGFVAEFSVGANPTTQPTTTTLFSNSNPAVTGTSMIFTAIVEPVTGTGVPTGSIVFTVDQVNVATVPLDANGVAAYSSAPLSLGQHQLLASYSGDTTYSPSANGFTQNVSALLPVFTPPTGIYLAAQLVTLTDTTPNTTMYYTTDGSTPTASSTKYTVPILVSTAETINAIAIASGAPASSVKSASYTLVGAPSVLAVSATASSVTASSATVNGLISTFGMTGSYYFVYGTSSGALTSSTTVVNLPSSVLSRLNFAPSQVSAALSGLASKTTYYYQVVVSSNAGTTTGQILSFTTN